MLTKIFTKAQLPKRCFSTATQGLETLDVMNENTPKPEINQNHVRLYGHPLCPFAEKPRIAL
jgi:hypothetical protein